MRTIVPLKIELKNFLSHKDTVFIFDEEGSHLIVGRNYDFAQKKSNGSGKTTIMNALLFVLTGKTLSGKRGDAVISEDETTCFVRFTFTNNGKVGYILTTRNPNQIVFFDGFKKHKTHSMTDLQSYIQEYFGFDFELLTKFILVGESERHKFSFLGADDREKKDLLTKLVSVQVIDNAEKIVKKHIDKYEKRLRTCKQQLEHYKEQINETKLLVAKYTTKKKTIFSEEKRRLLVDSKQKEKELSKKLIQISSKIKKMVDANMAEKDRLKAKQDKIGSIWDVKEKQLIKNESKMNSLYKRIAKITICPHCKKSIIPQEETLSLNQLKKELSNCELIKSSLKKETAGNEKQIHEIEKKIRMVNDEPIVKLNIVRGEIGEKLTAIRFKIQTLKSEKKALETLNNERVKEEEHKLLTLTDDKNNEILNLMELKKKLSMYNKYKYYFGKEGFKNYLFGKKLRVIEAQVNMYLDDTESGMSVRLSGMTKLKSGKYNQKISESITIASGKKPRKYSDLSKGESRVMDLVFIYAFADLLSFKTNFKLRMFDEPFGGLDKDGKKKVIRMFQRLPILNYIITPETSLSHYYAVENVIMIAKEDGQSYIEARG